MLKANLKGYVLRLLLKTLSVGLPKERIAKGSSFQSFGAAILKERSPGK